MTAGCATVHLLVPPGIDDPAHPSGGNVYDRELCAGLVGSGWTVHEHAVSPGAVAAALGGIGDGETVLVDGLVACTATEALLGCARRLRLVPLVHMPFRVPGERELLVAAAAVVVTSRWTSRWLVEHYGVDADSVHVATPGTRPAGPTAPSPSGSRLLCVGPVTTAKGYDDLLAALGQLDVPDWQCTWVGPHDHPVRRSERITLAGPLVGADLEAAYAGADLLVHPSRQETYGMVVTEALAHAVPVLATAVGGVPEALGEADGGPPGILVPPRDPARLAVALRRWLTEPRLRKSLRRRARRRSGTLPGWESTAAAVVTALEAVNRRPPGSVEGL